MDVDFLSRKRPSSATDVGPSRQKKRVIAASNGISRQGSPASQNTATEPREREPHEESLESFRKEAIFRRMRQYERDKKRAEMRVIELEQRTRELQGTVGAIENCWNQVLNHLHLLAKVDSLDLPQPGHVQDLLQLIELHSSGSDSPSEVFRRALLEDSLKTTKLVTAFLQLTTSSESMPTRDCAELRAESLSAIAQSTSLRSELHVMNASLIDARNELSTYKESLSQAETRAERLRREIQLLEKRVLASAQETLSSDDPNPKPTSIEGSGGKTKSEPQSPGVENEAGSTKTNGAHEVDSDEIEILQQKVQRLEAEIQRIQSDKVRLASELHDVNAKIASHSEDVIKSHPAYLKVVQTVGVLKGQLDAALEGLATAKQDAAEKVEHAEKTANAEINRLTQELQIVRDQYEKKLREVLKSKDQRDSSLREVAMLKAAETTKHQDRDAIEFRTKSLEERVEGLKLETKRLKARLAANTGQADLLSFILQNDSESLSFVDDLRTKLKSAQAQAAAMQATIGSMSSENSNVSKYIKSEAEARQESAELRSRLEGFEKAFGPYAQLSTEAQDLSARLQEARARIEKLELEREQESASSNDVFDELQRMSSAWEILDRQSKAKIDDGAAWEAKLSRISVEKAKAEQKYFATMREKEALDAERKATTRSLSQQEMLIAKMSEAQRELEVQNQISKDLAKEAELQIKSFGEQLEKSEQANANLKLSQEHEKQKAESYKSSLELSLAETERVRLDVTRLEEDLARAKKTAQKDIARLAKTSASTGSMTGNAREEEVSQLMLILRCSTCNQNLRSHILVKCMHTFCKTCIESRIATRQRKCPACGIGFKESEFQSLYFQ